MTLYEAILDDVRKDYAEMGAYIDAETAKQFDHEFDLQTRELKFRSRVAEAFMTNMDKLTEAFVAQRNRPNITIQVDSSMTPEKFEEIMKIVNKYR